MLKKHYYFPAVFYKCVEGGYCVDVAGMDGCLTQGEDLEDAFRMAKDAIGLYLYDEIYEDRMPEPVDIDSVKIEYGKYSEYYTDAKVLIVDFQPEEYLRSIGEMSVKKTLSIPEWLNHAGIKKGINFSQLLQEALREKLGLN